MSKTKSSGLTRLGRDSAAQRLGIKKFAGQIVKTGMIIVRQRGTKFLPGKNVKIGSDDTIYAIKNGIVRFGLKSKIHFNGKQKVTKTVNII